MLGCGSSARPRAYQHVADGCYATTTSMMALIAGVQLNMTFALARVSHLRSPRYHTWAHDASRARGRSSDFAPVALTDRLTRGANEEPDGGPGHASNPRCPDCFHAVALGVGPLLDRGRA